MGDGANDRLTVCRTLRHDHDNSLATYERFAVLVCADGFERDDPTVFTDVSNRASCRDRVTEENGCSEFHRLRQIDDFSVLEFVAEHRRDKRSAQHTVCNTAAKSRLFRKLLVEVYRIIVAPHLGKFVYYLVRDFARCRKAVAYLNFHILKIVIRGRALVKGARGSEACNQADLQPTRGSWRDVCVAVGVGMIDQTRPAQSRAQQNIVIRI